MVLYLAATLLAAHARQSAIGTGSAWSEQRSVGLHWQERRFGRPSTSSSYA